MSRGNLGACANLSTCHDRHLHSGGLVSVSRRTSTHRYDLDHPGAAVLPRHRQKGISGFREWIQFTLDGDGRCIGFELGDRQWSDPHDIAPDRTVPLIRDRPLLFFVHQSDVPRRRQLREMYPGGEERREKQPFVDRDYYTYYVPR